jgi:hypothetical protein
LLGGEIDGEAADARTKITISLLLCQWFLPPSVARMWSRIHHPPPEKSTCESKCFFQLSVPHTRNVKRPSDEKRASRVKCPFGTIKERNTYLHAVSEASALHLGDSPNFTAA